MMALEEVMRGAPGIIGKREMSGWSPGPAPHPDTHADLPRLTPLAAEWVANKGLMVIDARISRNVVTIPYRRIHYGRDD